MPPSPSTTGKAPAVSWDSSLWVQPRAGVPLPWGPQATALGRAGWRLQALPLARNTLHTSGPHFLLDPCGSGKELGLGGLSPEVCGARRGRRRATVCAEGGRSGGELACGAGRAGACGSARGVLTARPAGAAGLPGPSPGLGLLSPRAPGQPQQGRALEGGCAGDALWEAPAHRRPSSPLSQVLISHCFRCFQRGLYHASCILKCL